MEKFFTKTIILCFLLFGSVCSANLLTISEFQAPIGSTLSFTGLNGGVQGTVQYTFNAYPQLGPNGRETIARFTTSNPAQNYTIQMRGINDALSVSTYTSPSIEFTQVYDPSWSLLPPFVQAGSTYNSSAGYTYTYQGTSVTGSINASILIVGIESLTIPIGTFETLKAQATVVITESWSSGWAQTSQTQTIWYARSVGAVKQIISSTITSNTGENSSSDTNLVLSQSSVELPPQPVYPKAQWGKFSIIDEQYVDTGNWFGFLEVSKAPWVYSYSLGSYLYIPDGTAEAGRGWLYSP